MTNNDNEMLHRTSVSLYQRHIDFMESESKNRSKFVRTLLDEHIEQRQEIGDFTFEN